MPRVHALALALLFAAAPDALVAQGGRAAAVSARTGYTEADVRFMQGMLQHHAQAVVMAALVAERTERPELRLLAERIDVSQQEEMAMMRRWLRERGEALPDSAGGEHAGHAGHHAASPAMPGMLTPAELSALRAARGDTFDQLFLQGMIRHHEGALAMVATLLATPGAGREPQLYQFAADVDADQRAEIARMRRLLR